MKRLSLVIGATLALVLGALFAPTPARALSDEQELVDLSRITFQKMIEDKQFEQIPKYVKNAKAVLIMPNQIKAGFIIGGEYGSGVLLARKPGGGWSYPAFYTLGGGSIGLQIGGQAAEVVFTIMTDNGLRELLSNQVKLGADLSIAVGPVGAGIAAGTTTNFGADIYQFSKAEGLFGGGALTGSIVGSRGSYNENYYGKGATPQGILIDNRYTNAGADWLVSLLGRY
jgi:SH3 domain-containing YSC84-like protein 1